MLDQAKEYLARVVPWPQDGEQHFVSLHWTFMPKDGNVRTDKNGKQLLPWAGRACRSVDEAVRSLEWQLRQDSGARDIYLCLGAQAQAQEVKGPKNYAYFKPIRQQTNVTQLKSIFLDIDFKGGEHGYDTPGEAVEALTKFIADTGMPKPTLVVKSGGGIHVYWTMMRALTRDEWQPLANALAEATKKNGLKCDTQCTIDSVRVLRVPNTFNYKTDTPRPVTLAGKRQDFDYDPDRLWKALEPYKTAYTPPAVKSGIVFEQPGTLPKALQALGVGAELGAGLGHDPVHLDTLARSCPFINDAITSGGKDYSNPIWNLTTLIATFTDDARNDAHRMGNKHPGYTKETTDEFFDRKDRERQEKGLGFPSCATISGSGCSLCQICPQLAAGRSPLAAGRNGVQAAASPQAGVAGVGSGSLAVPAAGVPGAAPVIIDHLILPENYIRDKNTDYVCAIENAMDGKQHMFDVCKYRMDTPWLQMPEWLFHFSAYVDRGSKPTTISIPVAIVNGMEMRRTVQEQGLMIPSGKGTQRFGDFLMNWIHKLQQTRDSVRSAPFGWTVENGKTSGFVFNGTLFQPGGAESPAASTDPVLASHYSLEGDMQPWLDAGEIITSQGRQDLAVLLASSFAAPLVRFTGHDGALLSTYSTDSGVGKTTTLKVAQSVWGHPRKAMQSLEDTQNSVMFKLGQIRSLPLYWDEIKSEDQAKTFVKIVFQTTGGKEKSRMTRDLKMREPGSWQTLLINASNESILDIINQKMQTTTAGLYRVFEYVVKPAPDTCPVTFDSSWVTRQIAKLNDNYGHAGLIYAKYLGNNFVTIEAEMEQLLKDLGKELQIKPDERFWQCLIATILLGAKYGNDLQLTKFDLAAMKTFLVEQLTRMRGYREAQPVDLKKQINLSSLLQRFLSAHRQKHTLISNRIHRGRGKPPHGAYKALTPMDPTKIDGLFVHIGKDDRVIRISSTRLSLWCREVGISRDSLTGAMRDELGMTTVNGRLGSGVPNFNDLCIPELLLEIDASAIPLLDGFFTN